MIKKNSTEEVIEMLNNYPEQSKFDWKKGINISNEYKKSEIAKDVIAIANAHGNTDGFIIYGVNPEKEDPIIGISTTIDDATIQQIVNSKVKKLIDFLYFEEELKGRKIGIIKVTKNQKRPFIVKQDYGILKKGTIPIRKGSSTDFASEEDLEKMYYDPKRTEYIHIRATALLNKIYEGASISFIVGEYLELMKMIWDKNEIDWATSELKGMEPFTEEDLKKHNCRQVRGYRSIVDIQYPGFYTFDQIRLGKPEYFGESTIFMNQPILELEQYIPKGESRNTFIKYTLPRPSSNSKSAEKGGQIELQIQKEAKSLAPKPIMGQPLSTKKFVEKDIYSDLLKQIDKIFFYVLPIEIEKAITSIKQKILNRLISL